MNQENIPTDAGKLQTLKKQHLQTLTAPLDGYWEQALIGLATHYELKIDGQQAGFYCLNKDNQLVAFYLSPAYLPHAELVFTNTLHQHHISTALAGTNDPLFLSLCLDQATHTQVHTLLFQDHQNNQPQPTDFNQLSFTLATADDFDDLLAHYIDTNDSMDTDSIESTFDNLKTYTRSLIDNQQVFILREKNELIAISECRISQTQPPYADVGMIVAKAHRCQGLGSYILARTKAFCYEQNLKPICSCEATNIGSKKAILNAGFFSPHRIVQLTFIE